MTVRDYRGAYTNKRNDIDRLITRITEGLDGHAECHAAEFTNYGYIGDLSDIHKRLKDISDQLWNEGEYAEVA